jgi:hypothetical protein
MTSTDNLIHSLASAASTRRSASLRAVLTLTSAASLACAILLVLSVIGIRQDFAAMVGHMPFAFKLAYTVALVVGASVVALNAATPGASATVLCTLLPAFILLALGVMFDPTGFPIMGRTNTAVVFCVGAILFVSLPAVILTFIFMRQGAPTRPVVAGAVIGMLSASVGALAYTLACKNDGTAFVAIWYTVACVIMAAASAAIGHRALRW